MKKLIFCTLLILSTALFADYSYFCLPNPGMAVDQIIKISGNNVEVSSPDEVDGLFFKAEFDADYKPQKPGKVRFRGEEDGNNRDVILTAEMLKGGMKMKNGKLGGFMQIRGSEDGYWSESYVCFAK